MYISKRSGMDHTVLPANTPCLPEQDKMGVFQKEDKLDVLNEHNSPRIDPLYATLGPPET